MPGLVKLELNDRVKVLRSEVTPPITSSLKNKRVLANLCWQIKRHGSIVSTRRWSLRSSQRTRHTRVIAVTNGEVEDKKKTFAKAIVLRPNGIAEGQDGPNETQSVWIWQWKVKLSDAEHACRENYFASRGKMGSRHPTRSFIAGWEQPATDFIMVVRVVRSDVIKFWRDCFFSL